MKKQKPSEFAIYILLSPFDDKKMYISRSGPHRLRKTYTEHTKLRVSKTKALFELAAEANSRVPMYLLETSCMTRRESFAYMVAWTRYFLEHGYTQITKDILTDYAEDLVSLSEAHYNSIQELNIDDVISPQNRILQDYAQTRKPSQEGRHVISIRLDPEDYITVRENAKACNLSMGAYCKQRILGGNLIYIDFSYIDDSFQQYAENKMVIRQIHHMIYTTSKYYPADIRNLTRCVSELISIYERITADLREFTKKYTIKSEKTYADEISKYISQHGDRETVISVFPDQCEYNNIQQTAAENNYTVNNYCNRMVTSGRIIQIDLQYFRSFRDKATTVKSLLRKILFKIYTSQKYLPSDLARIQRNIDQLTEVQRNAFIALSDALRAIN